METVFMRGGVESIARRHVARPAYKHPANGTRVRLRQTSNRVAGLAPCPLLKAVYRLSDPAGLEANRIAPLETSMLQRTPVLALPSLVGSGVQ